MPGHIDIPLQELLVYKGDELIVDGADLATFVVLEHGTGIATAGGSDREPGGASDGTPRRLGRRRPGDHVRPAARSVKEARATDVPTICDVAASLRYMTLHRGEEEVGVRALHDRLSEHLDRVEQGVEIVVTRRGRRVARLSAIGRDEALAELVRRGLVRLPQRPRSRRRASVAARGSVSELVSEQRR